MKNKIYLLLLMAGLFQFIACKKDSQKQQSLPPQSIENGLVTFSINGELLNATIDTVKNLISIVIPRTFDMHNLKVDFTLANQVNASVGNKEITSGSYVDFSKIVYLTISSADKKRSTTFQLQVMTDLQYFGVAGNVLEEKSLNKDYNYYFDQFDGSQYQTINCGPTVSTMAIRLADSTFTKKPADARNTFLENGGWWSTTDVGYYLKLNGINFETDTLSNLDSLVTTNIDKNNSVILCLDMFYVPYNDTYYQHTEKFYSTNAPNWGHFLLVKGYKQTQNGFYLEIYDPYSQNRTYTIISSGQPEGKDRYYSLDGIIHATNIWWPYAIVVAPKGQQVTASASTRVGVNSINKNKPIPVAYGR